MMIGVIVGLVTLFYATTDDSVPMAMDTPITLAPAFQRVKRGEPPPATDPPASIPISEQIPKPTEDRPSGPLATIPDQLRGKLRFATLTAELTRGGIDARREDGACVLVVWRDVVGAVARRLPADHDGATFVDIVSSQGSTLRILPWTRLSGDPLEITTTDSARALAIVELIVARCPDITLDPATRSFVESRGQASQLPDRETLAAHDARLA